MMVIKLKLSLTNPLTAEISVTLHHRLYQWWCSDWTKIFLLLLLTPDLPNQMVQCQHPVTKVWGLRQPKRDLFVSVLILRHLIQTLANEDIIWMTIPHFNHTKNFHNNWHEIEKSKHIYEDAYITCMNCAACRLDFSWKSSVTKDCAWKSPQNTHLYDQRQQPYVLLYFPIPLQQTQRIKSRRAPACMV